MTYPAREPKWSLACMNSVSETVGDMDRLDWHFDQAGTIVFWKALPDDRFTPGTVGRPGIVLAALVRRFFLPPGTGREPSFASGLPRDRHPFRPRRRRACPGRMSASSRSPGKLGGRALRLGRRPGAARRDRWQAATP